MLDILESKLYNSLDIKESIELLHHIEHLVLYSFVIWQIALAVWLILRWFVKNVKFNNRQNFIVSDQKSVNSPDFVTENKINKKVDVIDVEVKKDIFIDRVDNKDLKTDEVIKGKVTTQKDKLKALRRK